MIMNIITLYGNSSPFVNIFPTGTVPFHCNAVTLLPKVPDKNIKVTVNEADSSQPVFLNFGDTMVEISVYSADGSNSQVESAQTRHYIMWCVLFGLYCLALQFNSFLLIYLFPTLILHFKLSNKVVPHHK